MSDEMATAVWFLATEPARARRILDRHRPDDDGRCRYCRRASNPCPDCKLSGWALRALDVVESLSGSEWWAWRDVVPARDAGPASTGERWRQGTA
jgi:hypothetical protein